ncbi:MAG: hypothetical protein LBU98_01955, partial [Alistipes sp.]|nr:hypothetical protein [Alistipes sp.]
MSLAPAVPVARVAQASKQLLCPLRGLRKRQNNFFARCAGCASIKTTFLPVARAAQAPKQLFCPLRGLRKRQNNFFARCAGCASAAEVVLPVRQRPAVTRVPTQSMKIASATKRTMPAASPNSGRQGGR